MKKCLLSSLAMIATSSIMLSCSSASSEIVENWEEPCQVVSMMQEQKPINLTKEQKVFANDNNGFALNFLKTVNDVDQSGKSFIYSPLSITYLLGMVNDAAIGATEQEIEQTLGFHQGGIKAVNEYCKKLIDGLPKVDPSVKLSIANAIFLNKDFTLKKQFEQDMKDYYDAKAEALDFSSPNTLPAINGWCNEKTKGMIPNILDDVNPAVVSYLLNAIYFKADWASKFDPQYTKTEPFSTENAQTQLPLMHQKVLISYAKNELFSAIQIPYGNSSWNMTVLLPEEGKTTDDIINELSKYVLADTKDEYGYTFQKCNFSNYEVDLKLPRFETSSDTNDLDDDLTGLLKEMGIKLVFDDTFAEIPNMCEDTPIYISMMRQKAKIQVNEEGSEAAAVTIAGANGFTSMEPHQPPKATFHANRPFVYVISEAVSGVILFVGKFTGA